MTAWSRRAGGVVLGGILLLGLGVRLGWDFYQSPDPANLAALPDQREYFAIGQHVRQGDGFWFADPRFGQPVYAYRTPGYPLLIAGVGPSLRMIRAVQAGLDASSILAIYLLARRWLPREGAALAAAIVAVNPFLIFFSGLILSETLFTAMLCWGITLLVLSDGPWPAGKAKLASWLGGGFLLALSVLVRPGAIALPLVLGAAAALVNARGSVRQSSRWPLPVLATMLLLIVIVLFPWAARNRWRVGAWVWTSTNEGITRYDGFNPNATGASDQRFVASMPWTTDMTEVARSNYFQSLADDWIAAHPADAIGLAGVKIARTWSPMPLSGEYGGKRLYRLVGLAFGIPMDILTLIGLNRKNLPRPAKWLLLLPALYFTLGAALSVGSLRYRIPADAPMAIVAASALSARRAESAGAEKI